MLFTYFKLQYIQRNENKICFVYYKKYYFRLKISMSLCDLKNVWHKSNMHYYENCSEDTDSKKLLMFFFPNNKSSSNNSIKICKWNVRNSHLGNMLIRQIISYHAYGLLIFFITDCFRDRVQFKKKYWSALHVYLTYSYLWIVTIDFFPVV